MAGAVAGRKEGVPRINKYPVIKSDRIQGKPEQKLNSMLTFFRINPECNNREGHYENEKQLH